MFVTTARPGASSRNERSLSSASATSNSPRPTRRCCRTARAVRRSPPSDRGPRGRAPARSSTSSSSCRARRRWRCPARARISSASSCAAQDHRDPAPARFRRPPGSSAAPPTTAPRVDVADVGGVVALVEVEPQRLQVCRSPSDAFTSEPLTRDALPQQNLRERAHAAAADTDEVHAPGPASEHRAHAPVNATAHVRRSTRAASGRASVARRLAPCARGPPGSAASANIATASRFAAQLALVDHLGRAGLREDLRVLPLVVVGGRRQRDRIAGLPEAVISASVVAPARQTTRSASFISRSISYRNGSTRATEAGPLVALANHGQVALSGLVSDSEWCGQRPPASALPPHRPR